jgi:hypothetical protein
MKRRKRQADREREMRYAIALCGFAIFVLWACFLTHLALTGV